MNLRRWVVAIPVPIELPLTTYGMAGVCIWRVLDVAAMAAAIAAAYSCWK